MSPRELEELLAAQFEGALDAAGAERLDGLLADDAGAAGRFAGLLAVEGLLRARAAAPETKEALTRRVMRAVHREGSRRRFTGTVMASLPEKSKPAPRKLWRTLAAAAVLLLAAVGAWLLLKTEPAGVITAAAGDRPAGSSFAYGEILATEKDQGLALKLADGSLLTLAAESAVTVTRRREAHLAAGELRLRCESDRKNPFSVFAGGTEVRAVGTEFSVKIEDAPGVKGPLPNGPPEEKEKSEMRKSVVTVMVISGIVLVSNAHGRLEAGEGKTVVSVAGKAPAAKKKPAPGEDQLQLATYDVRDLLSAGINKKSKKLKAWQRKQRKLLVQDIKAKVLPNSWAPKKCTIEGRGSKLIVMQTERGHKAIAGFLAARRAARRAARGAARGAAKDEKPPVEKTDPEPDAVKDDSPDDDPLDKKISFEFVQTPLSEVCKFLSVMGVKVTCDEELAEKLITLKMKKASIRMTLDWVAKLAGARANENKDGSFTITRNKAAAGKKKPAKSKPEVF